MAEFFLTQDHFVTILSLIGWVSEHGEWYTEIYCYFCQQSGLLEPLTYIIC